MGLMHLLCSNCIELHYSGHAVGAQDTMISDMKGAHLGPCQLVSREPDEMQIPEDIYYSVAMGADIGSMPQNSLMTVTGVEAANTPAQKAFMQCGDFCVVAGKDRLPVVLGVLMGFVQHDDEEHGLCPGCRLFVYVACLVCVCVCTVSILALFCRF